jgi:menaquinone-dependent protoporphyrinogen oxidase
MPSPVLVAYATKHGATAEIAEAIADQLRADGLDAEARRAGEVRSLDQYSAVVLGSAVYMKRWRREARHFLRHHHDALAHTPLWVFSSGAVGEHRDPQWEEPAKIVETVERLGAREHVVFGGRVPQDPGNFVERAMLRDTPPEVADLRDFDAIRSWASGIAAALAMPTSVPQREATAP